MSRDCFGNFSALRACHRPRFAKFSRSFRENFSKTLARNIFSKSRSRRRDQFGPKIVKIRAILAIFEPFEVFGCQKSQIFERLFTPRGWLRSASNFGKTRFRRSPTFHLSTSKTKKSAKIFEKKFRRKSHLENSLGVRTADSLSGKGITAPQRQPLQPQWSLIDP